MAVDPLTSGQPPEYVQEQLFQEINEWINARFPLDNELTLIGESVNAIIARLALIQRDDGEIANESVGYDQLKPEVVPGGIGAIEGWVDMKQYAVRDSVFYLNSWYVCKLAHTASPTNRPDVDVPEGETEGTYWVLINDFSLLFEEVLAECEVFRDQAQEWAQAPEDQPIDDGTNTGFSAFHWSEKAAETVAGIQPDLDQLQANIDAEEAARIAADDAIVADMDTNRVKKIAGTTGTPDTGAAEIPTGTTVQAPAGTTTALLRFDMDLSKFRGFNPVKGEYTDIGGGGLVEVEIVTDDFQVEAGKVYGIDLSTNDIITADVPGGFDENDWFGIIDIGNAFDDSHGCVIQLTSDEFVIADPDNAFYAGEANSFYAFQKVNGKYILGQSSYGQDATWAVDKINNGYSEWASIVDDILVTSTNNTEDALMGRWIDAKTYKIAGIIRKDAGFTAGEEILQLPKTNRLLKGQDRVCVPSDSTAGAAHIALAVDSDRVIINSASGSVWAIVEAEFILED